MSEDKIKTKDVDEAAFLWTSDDKFSLYGIEMSQYYGRNIIWFVFAPKVSQKEIEKIRNDYRFGKCLVEPRKYASKRSEIKSIIRERCSSNN